MFAAPDDAIAVTRFRGFDPRSPGLIGPNHARGVCLEGFPEGRTLVWYDKEVQMHTGGTVVIAAQFGDEMRMYGKVLERTRDGRWWGVCEQGALPLDALPIVYMAAIVLRLVFPESVASCFGPAPELSGADRTRLRRLGNAAYAEWAALGFPSREAFPYGWGRA